MEPGKWQIEIIIIIHGIYNAPLPKDTKRSTQKQTWHETTKQTIQEKRNDFKRDLNMVTEDALRTLMGIVFHMLGAATEKALSPAHFLVLGTRRLRPWSERVVTEPSRDLLTTRHSSMY